MRRPTGQRLHAGVCPFQGHTHAPLVWRFFSAWVPQVSSCAVLPHEIGAMIPTSRDTVPFLRCLCVRVFLRARVVPTGAQPHGVCAQAQWRTTSGGPFRQSGLVRQSSKRRHLPCCHPCWDRKPPAAGEAAGSDRQTNTKFSIPFPFYITQAPHCWRAPQQPPIASLP